MKNHITIFQWNNNINTASLFTTLIGNEFTYRKIHESWKFKYPDPHSNDMTVIIIRIKSGEYEIKEGDQVIIVENEGFFQGGEYL